MQLSVLKILLFSIIGLVGYYYVPQRYRKSFLALLSTIFYLQYRFWHWYASRGLGGFHL